MAALNLRDKVIEARVACIGLDLDAVTEELEGSARVEDAAPDRIEVDVGPFQSERLRDCALRLRLMAQRSGHLPADVRTLLDAADGVVIALHHADTERNVKDIALVLRDVLAGRQTPVIVHWTPAPSGVAELPAHFAAALASARWVNAREGLSSGVDETLNQVVDAVIESMSQGTAQASASNDTAPADRQEERNPLFNALRRMLEKTVEEHTTKLASDVSERLERSLEGRLRGLADRVDAVEQSHRDLTGLVRDALAERSTTSADVVAALESTASLFQNHQQKTSEELLKAARHSCSREDLAASLADLRSELARILEASDGATREVLSSSTALRKSMEAIGGEVRRTASKEAVLELTKKVTELKDESASQLTAIAAAVPELPARLASVETASRATARDTGRATERLGALDAGVNQLLRGLETDHPRLERIEGLVNELVEESKRPKKGWFG